MVDEEVKKRRHYKKLLAIQIATAVCRAVACLGENPRGINNAYEWGGFDRKARGALMG